MDRSVGNMWPRAASVVYEEPKRLVALGYATAKATSTGKRPSTTYGITAKGRRALRRWLEQPGAGPVTEFEGLVKVAFADHGSIEGLRANLRAIREHAEAEVADAERRFEEYAETGGPYPDRLPIIALAAEHFRLQSEALLRWVDWAERATQRVDRRDDRDRCPSPHRRLPVARELTPGQRIASLPSFERPLAARITRV